MLQIFTKTFEELSTQELYDLLQLRAEVFVVEQECAYQDVDGKDQKAWHILAYKDKKLVAYTRFFKPGDYFKEASIGRVLVVENQRKHKYGYDIMEASITAIKENFNETTIKISAQCYLKRSEEHTSELQSRPHLVCRLLLEKKKKKKKNIK